MWNFVSLFEEDEQEREELYAEEEEKCKHTEPNGNIKLFTLFNLTCIWIHLALSLDRGCDISVENQI